MAYQLDRDAREAAAVGPGPGWLAGTGRGQLRQQGPGRRGGDAAGVREKQQLVLPGLWVVRPEQ